MYVKRVLPNGGRLITERIDTVRTASVGIWAVSYTHLDVYKRQTQALLRAILEQYNDNQEQAGDNHYD